MNILLIWDSEYPWDVRVEKVARALVEGGHKVAVLARNKHGRARQEKGPGFDIHRIAALETFSFLNSALTFPAFFNPVWLTGIHDQAKQADLILVRDLPLAPAALLVGRRLGIPVIFDMAECYPEMLRAMWKFSGVRPQDVLVRNPLLADIVERAVVSRMDHILVMVEESRERLIRLGVAPRRISIVSNTPVIKRFERVISSNRLEQGDCLELVYIGILGYSRGLSSLVTGLASYAKENPRIHLSIYGHGRAAADLEKQIRNLRGDGFVSLRGYIPNEAVPGVLRESHVGVIPHLRSSHWDNTIPNKLFDYMAAGLPVLASDAVPVSRILSATGAGITYRSADSEDLLRSLRTLADPGTRRSMGECGRRAVETTFNWESDKAVLLQAVDSVIPRKKAD